MDQSTIDWTSAEMGATNSIASRFRNENLAELIRGPGKHVRFRPSIVLHSSLSTVQQE